MKKMYILLCFLVESFSAEEIKEKFYGLPVKDYKINSNIGGLSLIEEEEFLDSNLSDLNDEEKDIYDIEEVDSLYDVNEEVPEIPIEATAQPVKY